MSTPVPPHCAVPVPDCFGFRIFPGLPSVRKGGYPVLTPPDSQQRWSNRWKVPLNAHAVLHGPMGEAFDSVPGVGQGTGETP